MFEYLPKVLCWYEAHWPQWLNWTEYWYNTNYRSSTKATPSKAFYGREAPSLLKRDSVPSSIEEVNKLIHETNLMLDEIKEQLVKAQNRMKTQVDKHRRELEFIVEEKVYPWPTSCSPWQNDKTRTLIHASMVFLRCWRGLVVA